jgi:hypothetical protein
MAEWQRRRAQIAHFLQADDIGCELGKIAMNLADLPFSSVREAWAAGQSLDVPKGGSDRELKSSRAEPAGRGVGRAMDLSGRRCRRNATDRSWTNGLGFTAAG